jgi:hypothetical protein
MIVETPGRNIPENQYLVVDRIYIMNSSKYGLPRTRDHTCPPDPKDRFLKPVTPLHAVFSWFSLGRKFSGTDIGLA